jgi:hypothetical protein
VAGGDGVVNHMRPYLSALNRFPSLSQASDKAGGFAHLDHECSITGSPPTSGGAGPAWRIVAMNACDPDWEIQAKAIRTDLETHRGTPCILGFMHPFLLSSGWYGHAESKDPEAPPKIGDLAS